MNATLVPTLFISIFFFFIILGFVCGWVRGLNKSLTRLLMVLCCAVLAFFVVPAISKAILAMDISKFNIVIGDVNVKTVEDLIGDLLRDIPVVDDIIASSPTFESFIAVLPLMIVNVVFFVLFFFLFKWFTMIIYWIIAGVCFNKKKMEGKEKHGFIGAVLGAVQGLIAAIVIFVPCFGILATAQPLLDATAANAQTQQEETVETTEESTLGQLEDTMNEVKVYVDAANNNWVFKMLGAIGIKQLSVGMYDNLTTVKKNNVTYSLRREVKTIADAYPELMYVVDHNFDIKDEQTLTNLKGAINDLYKSPVLSGMVREIVPEMAAKWRHGYSFCGVNKPNFDNEDIANLFDSLLERLDSDTVRNSNALKDDLINAIDLLVDVNKSGLIDVIAGDGDLLAVIRSEDGSTLIYRLLSKVTSSPIFEPLVPQVVNLGLGFMYDMVGIERTDANKVTVEEGTKIVWEAATIDGVTYRGENNVLQSMFSNICELYGQLQDNSAPEADPLDSLNFELLGATFDDMRESQLLGPISFNVMKSFLTSPDIVGENTEILNTFIGKLENAWNSNDKLAPTFLSIGDAVKLAKQLKSDDGDINLDNLGGIIESLRDASSNEAIKEVVDELVNENTLKDFGVPQDAAGVISDTFSALLGASDEEFEAGVTAAEDIFGLAQKVLSDEESSYRNEDGKVDLHNDDVDALLDSLGESSIVLDAVCGAAESGGSKSFVGDNLSEDTKGYIEKQIQEKFGGDSDTASKLKDLFGIQ